MNEFIANEKNTTTTGRVCCFLFKYKFMINM